MDWTQGFGVTPTTSSGYFTRYAIFCKIVPFVSQVGSHDIVHHMDLFVCQEAVDVISQPRKRNRWCSEEKFR